MSAIKKRRGPVKGSALPTLRAVAAGPGLSLDVTWDNGAHETVDVGPVVNSYRVFRPLRRNRALFRRVRLGDFGASVTWTDEIDMDALTVARMAQQTRAASMSAQAFRGFLKQAGLSLTGAASALGISRRNIAYFASGSKSVPREVALACHGYVNATDAPPFK